MPEPQVFLNGKFMPASQAHLAVFDAGIVLGATVTEMTRTFRHNPWRLDAHLDRLYRGLKYMQLAISMSRPDLRAKALELIHLNAQLISPEDELGLVQFVTPGEYATYAPSPKSARSEPTVCMHTFVLPFEMWAKKMTDGIHLVTPSIRHVPPECYDPKMKCRSRMHYYLAEKEARRLDPDASALLLDLEGNITETNSANFMIVEKDVIVSPSRRNILPGVSRAMVVELATKLGLGFVERDIQVFDAINADEALATSTPYCIMPVTRINGTIIGEGRPGPVTLRLLEAWSAEVGVDISEQIQAGARRRTT